MKSEQNYRQGRPIVLHGEQVFCNGATNQRTFGAPEYRSVVRDKRKTLDFCVIAALPKPMKSTLITYYKNYFHINS